MSQNHKLCLLCQDSPEWPYPKKDEHERFGMHFTLGRTWRPEKGHKDYELSKRWMKLLSANPKDNE